MSQPITLITGSTDGIGLELAKFLAKQGHRLIIHGRCPDKGRQVVSQLKAITTKQEIIYFNADFSDLAQVKQLAKAIQEYTPCLDNLVNNAGIMQSSRKLSKDGIEMTLAVNHIAPFLLTQELLPLLHHTPSAHIINVSSQVHSREWDPTNLQSERHFDPTDAYAISKLCNLLFTFYLSDKLQSDNIRVNACHPGVINTKLLRDFFGAGPHLPTYSETLQFLVTSSQAATWHGQYIVNNVPTQPAAIALDKKAQLELWTLSNQLVKAFIVK